MKHLLFLLPIVLISLVSSKVIAQANYEDVLYLKNGTIIHGLIIEQVPNETIKIQSSNRNVFVFRMDEVLKIAREEIVTTRKTRREPLTRENIKKRGFTNITELTLGRDVLDNGSDAAVAGYATDEVVPSLGIQTITGYMFNSYVIAGLGIAINTNSEIGFVPFFDALRFNFQNGPTSPFLNVEAGYSFTVKEIYALNNDRDYFGGTYFHPSLGIKFNVGKSKALSFSLGYRNQEARIYVVNYGTYPDYTVTSEWKNYTIGYLNTKVGIIF